MKRNTVMCSVACFGAALFVSSAASAEALNVKPGAWEMTVTTTPTSSAMTPKELAKLPAYRRSMIEKTMANRGGKPNTSVHKSCVTKEDLDHDLFGDDDDSNCTRRTVSRTASRMVVATSCLGTPREGTVSFEAKTPQSVVGTIDQPTSGGKLHVDITSRWLGASCAGIPDRLVKMK